jgi:flagellar hook-associated protein 3 FlgL
MTSSIGTAAQAQQMQQLFLQLQAQETTLSTQVSTGLVSQSFAGIAPQAGTLVDLTTQASQEQSYLSSNTVVGTRMQLMSNALSDIENLVSQFSEGFTSSAFSSGNGISVQQEAKELLTEVGDDLNTQDGSSYVFSGAQTDTPAFNPNNLPNPGNLATADTAYYGGDDTIQQATINGQDTISYGITADNPAFEQIIRALNFIANAPPFSQNNPQDAANVQAASQLLTNGLAQLQTLQGTLGLQQNQVSHTNTTLQSTLSLAQQSISNLENVDPATAISELNQLQTQLQASYQTVALLQQVSLVNYLK